MATQFPQQQQPLQQQQPPVVFPNTVTNHPTQASHSDGSFGTVFIVLAVIVVVSAIACCLGRVCNKRHSKNKQHKQKNEKFRSGKEKESDGNDIEFGFEKGLASKPMGNGEHHGGGGRGFKTFHNGRINNISNGDHGPRNGQNGPMNGRHGPMNGHGPVTIPEPVFTVEEPNPGLGP